ncbi:hypothetical protein SAMN05444405_102202 [Bacteroides luti]|jgi:hypothetical protein|uniref:Uncharacterized protein n=1 Tax=Bacteroides luti TaxID=1297750 RepID=A0A1M4UZK4_9BACE|nr:hypothetical protein SAMN05444405_102202 [Bacteroides luti]
MIIFKIRIDDKDFGRQYNIKSTSRELSEIEDEPK